MRIYKSLFFCALVFLSACRGDKKMPADILPADQMTEVLIQIHILDGKMYNIAQAPDSLYKYGTPNYLAMFKKFHTDTAQFDKSFTYYTGHPDELDAIYDNVLKKLQYKVDSVAKIKTKNALPPK